MDDKKEQLGHQMEMLKKIRKEAGLNRRGFSEYMGIPLRSLEEWEAGRRKMPDYLLRLIAYQIKMEQFLREKGIDFDEERSENEQQE